MTLTPRLSNRIASLTDDADGGWEIYFAARELVAAGETIIDLTIGDHDIRTDPEILAAMDRSARGGHTGYAEIPGTDALRDAVARRTTTRTGVPTTRDNVLITAGAQAALFAAHIAVADPGETALFIDPYYATYPGTVRAAGLIPRPVAARAETGFQPQARDIRRQAHGARSLLINTPNNPTGAVYSRETLNNLANACRSLGLWLISDEVYDSQVWSGQHLSPRALPGMAERTLVVGSMSKSHAMTGSRCGWVIGPRDVIADLINLSTHTTYGVPGFVQDAATYALARGPELETRIAAPFRTRRDAALTALDGQNTVVPLAGAGAMYLLLDIRATGQDSRDFARALLHREHIAVMPGESFGAAAAGHIRISLTVAEDRLCDALQRISAFASGHTG
ncbi:MAG: pyridoxal phosphate-dependent aminotransferase [Marinibacterium sp.]